MGMCKGCKEVFSALDMKDGYCETCQISKPIENNISQNEEKKDNKIGDKQINFILSIILAIIVIGISIFGYNKMTKPSDSIVKSLVLEYDLRGVSNTDIKIINSYSKEGKTFFIIDLDRMTCEMPVIKSGSEWKSLGINCK